MLMLRLVFFYIMVLSFFGMGICDLVTKNYKTGIASILLGFVQLILFWR